MEPEGRLSGVPLEVKMGLEGRGATGIRGLLEDTPSIAGSQRLEEAEGVRPVATVSIPFTGLGQ